MPYELTDKLVVGISSRTLFDLEKENQIFENEHLEAYIRYQVENEDDLLKPGTAFPMVKAMLAANTAEKRLFEVIVMFRNSPDTGLRIFNSIGHYGIDITRAALTGGEPLAPYLAAFNVDLFLSKSKSDVQAAIDAGFAAALIYDAPEGFEPDSERIRIALDADAVLFAEESEQIYKEKGLDAFFEHERQHARRLLPEGPFAKFLKTISTLQRDIEPEKAPIRIAIVTARNSPAHERVIRTLREWGVRVDAAFFLGGVSKDAVLKAFRAHMFFDDQEVHLGLASTLVPAGLVPYRTGSPLKGTVEAAKGNEEGISTNSTCEPENCA